MFPSADVADVDGQQRAGPSSCAAAVVVVDGGAIPHQSVYLLCSRLNWFLGPTNMRN